MKELKNNLGWALANVKKNLANLAAPPDRQLAYLKSIGDECKCLDELALEFNDAFIFLNQFIEDRRVPEATAAAIAAVDKQLDAMSGEKNARLWTSEALATTPEWKEVRALAVRALALLGD